MKKFLKDWLAAILVVITVAFFTFHGGRASQESIDKLDKKVESIFILVNANAVQIGQLTGYIEGSLEKKSTDGN